MLLRISIAGAACSQRVLLLPSLLAVDGVRRPYNERKVLVVRGEGVCWRWAVGGEGALFPG